MKLLNLLERNGDQHKLLLSEKGEKLANSSL